MDTQGLIPKVFGMDDLKNIIKNALNEAIREWVEAFQTWLIDVSFDIALIGGGISILLYVGGFKKGLRYTGVLVVSHVIIRVIFG